MGPVEYASPVRRLITETDSLTTASPFGKAALSSCFFYAIIAAMNSQYPLA